jgi:hypothetical protein
MTTATQEQPIVDTKQELLTAEIEALPRDDVSRLCAERTATKLSFQNLLLKGYLEQTFDINKHIRVTMKTLSAGAVEYIYMRLSSTHGSQWTSIFDEALRIHYVAASLQALGTPDSELVPIGSDVDAALLTSPEAAKEVLDKRLQYVKTKPASLVYLLYSHYMLFSKRVDDFIKGSQELGNS